MIVSDQHRLIFVHVPKCAGTSIKSTLSTIDDQDGFFQRRVDHPEMGPVDFSHLRLADLAAHFPETYDKLRRYRSFAIVREPISRFVSAVHQRLREFEGLPQSQITPADVEREAHAVIDRLAACPERLPMELVHFSRQVDYLRHDGETVVGEVFQIEQLALAAAFVHAASGVEIDLTERKNSTTAIRCASLRPLVSALRRPYAALVPKAWRERLRSLMVRHAIYAPVRNEALVSSAAVERFVRSYYRDDFIAYEGARR